ncbi:MAG: hypothetical protein IPK64_04450 [bacterium]|nr:hypothetical protein [bacterium]
MPIRPRMRPTFEIPMKVDGTRTMARIKARLDRGSRHVAGQVVGCHAYVQVPSGRQTLLSPHLDLKLIQRGDKVVLHGRFGPRPNVWTGFMAVYGLLGMAGLGGLMLGWAQLSVKESAWGFWLVPASLALFAFVYGAAVIGQGLTQDEMYVLRHFVDRMVAGDEREEPLCDDEEPPVAAD